MEGRFTHAPKPRALARGMEWNQKTWPATLSHVLPTGLGAGFRKEKKPRPLGRGGFTFTEHAKHQLEERDISEEAVRRALRKPTKVIEQPSGRNRAVKKFRRGGKTFLLVVVYENTGADITVVTAFLTSKIAKYP